MLVLIAVKGTFCSLELNVVAEIVQSILHFQYSLRLRALWETRPEGLEGAEENSKQPEVFELVSTTAYSHLHANGLYGHER